MQLLLMEDQQLVQAFPANTAQKTFADRIGAFRVIGCFEDLDAACCCNPSETGPKLPVIITDKISGCLTIRSRLPKLLCSPGVGRRSCDPHMDDLPRLQFDDEKGKERPEKEIGDLHKITAQTSLA